jgi:hypothetical protein
MVMQPQHTAVQCAVLHHQHLLIHKLHHKQARRLTCQSASQPANCTASQYGGTLTSLSVYAPCVPAGCTCRCHLLSQLQPSLTFDRF